MLLKRFILLFYIVLPQISWAQGNSLSGTITDANGLPVYGAVVTIPDLRAGASTDSNGLYQIKNLPKGRYLIQVHMLSYNTLTVPLSIDGNTQRDFSLTESVLERAEVVITGSSLATEQRKSTIPITSIRLRELQEEGASNIIDAITRLPGVSQVSTGTAISKPVIRGLGANRVLVISDHVRQEGQQWGDEHGVEVDEYNLSRVEVLKGPASLAYGSDALAGVIHIITDDPLLDHQNSGNVALGYQTNNGLATGHARAAGRRGAVTWKVFGTVKAAHDYRNGYDGYVFNSRYRNGNYGASLGLTRRWGNTTLSYTSFNQMVGIPEGDRDALSGKFVREVRAGDSVVSQEVTDRESRSYTSHTPYQRIQHHKLAWNSNLFFSGGSRMGLTLGYQDNSRREFEEVLSPEVPGLDIRLRTMSYDLRYFLAAIEGWQLTAGVNGMFQRNRNIGLEFLIPDYGLFDAAVYAIARKEIGKWSISGGLRYAHRSLESEALYLDSTGSPAASLPEGGMVRFSGFRRSFANLAGSIGASYTVTSRTTLKANLATGYRAPNIAELSANGVHEGTVRYEYGRQDLAAENSLQADLGVVYNADHIHIDGALFLNYIPNYIYLRKLQTVTGQDSIPEVFNEEGYPAFTYQQADALLYGGEFYSDLHPHPLDWLHFENTISYVRGQRLGSVPDSIRNLPQIPPLRWLVAVRVQKRSLGSWIRNGYLKAGLDINLAQDHIFSAYHTETAAKGYTLLNAGLGFDLVNRRQKTFCTLVLAAQNLLDQPYQNHLSRLRYAPGNPLTGRPGIWNMGRNFSLQLNFPIQF